MNTKVTKYILCDMQEMMSFSPKQSFLYAAGTLKLDISPPGDKPPYCLTSELHQVPVKFLMLLSFC